jgi:hypothetical protein
MNKTLNQRIYETPADIKKAIYDSGYEAGFKNAVEQIFTDLFGKVGFDGHNVSIFKNELIEVAKKYGVD